MFAHHYKNARVFVTGHTGFKGSWLSAWLLKLGAEVCGYSKDIPTEPSNFQALGLENRVRHIIGDIRDMESLQKEIDDFRPNIVFHLAAQALVRRSYDNPVETFSTNILGFMHVLECLRRQPSVQAAVLITSDKCYRNVEWTWGYRENDTLGGDDPYSASKACAELIANSYEKSFFAERPNIATARAGNVIGGGDWAADRIIPDAIRCWSKEQKLSIRNPQATRPWQHVLEPLSGYLLLGAHLLEGNRAVKGEAFNFGPGNSVNQTVFELVSALGKYWKGVEWDADKPAPNDFKEATLLKLSCDKALNVLNWETTLNFMETAKITGEWYQAYYSKQFDMYDYTFSQINEYVEKTKAIGRRWAD